MREMFAGEAVTDITGKVLTFRVCGHEVAIQFWREVEIAVKFAAAEAKIEHVLGGKIGGRSEHARLYQLPMHDCIN